ncbi:MAG: polysaccharide biosynthesis/export family protein, partial [Myxococcota bacterium]
MRSIAASLVLGLFAAGCASGPGQWVWVWDLPPARAESPRIKPGDTLQITVRNQQSMSGQAKVQPNGTYVQPQYGAVSVAGMNEAEATQQLKTLLKGVLVNPRATIAIAVPGNNRLAVIGEVRNNGRVELRPEDGMLELLAQVGGLTQFADKDGIYLIRKSGDRPLLVRFDYNRLARGE